MFSSTVFVVALFTLSDIDLMHFISFLLLLVKRV